MGNLISAGNGREIPQVNRYGALLGPMLGGSFPASVAIYNLISKSSDDVKLAVFGAVTLAVFAVASGLAATSLGNTPGTACYARFAALFAVTIVLGLFTGGLCTLFTSSAHHMAYQVGCGVFFGLLTLLLAGLWLIFKW